MTEPAEPTDPTEPTDRPSATPFLAALAIFLIAVIGTLLFNVLRGEQRPPDQEVATAAVGQNDALQRRHYADFLDYTCRAHQGSEAQVIGAQRDSEENRGKRFVDDVTDVVIDGDRATAKVIYHFDEAPDTKTEVETTFVREDGAWKVCSPGPK